MINGIRIRLAAGIRLATAILLIAVLISACGGATPPPHRSQPAPSGPGATTAAGGTTSARTPAHRRRRATTAKRAATARRAASRPRAPRRPEARHRHHASSTTSPGAGRRRSGRAPASRHHPLHRAKPVSPAIGAEQVSIRLHGGSNATLTACGLQHHDHLYAPGSTIVFSGAVSPVPQVRWKVKLKIKVCRDGSYLDLGKFQVPVNKRTGTFSGSFPAPAPGLYEVTARLYLTGREVAKSLERHFQIS